MRSLTTPLAALGCAALALAAAPVSAQSEPAPVGAGASAAAATPNDYAKPDSWICRPGHSEPCDVDLRSTAIAADGSLEVETWQAAEKPPVDCFYVYPTVSLDPTPNSDMKIGPEEKNVVAAQLARFGSQCRIFAPLYRQVTLTALRQTTGGGTPAVDRGLAYRDVVAAWKHYLANDNQGRGFVLIGHSQGARMLTLLLQNEIDGKPIQNQLVSALLLGSNVAVPKGKDVGGDLKSVPLCRAPTQTGCLISYVSFRATKPPPADSRFGRVSAQGNVAACTNPASLAGGSGALHARLRRARAPGIDASDAGAATLAKLETPFYSLPGMLSAECVEDEAGSYLAIRVKGDPEDARMDDIPGDVVMDGHVVPAWGLHLIDMNVAMQDLVSIVSQQARSYTQAP